MKKGTLATDENVPQIIQDLYVLMLSMSRTEKRDFKRSRQQPVSNPDRETVGAKKQYLALYGLLQTYLEKNDTPHLEDLYKFLLKNHREHTDLNVLASYLFEKLLENLRNKPMRLGAMHQRLNQILSEIYLLYYRGLYLMAVERVEEGYKLARKLEKAHYLLELCLWDRRLHQQILPPVEMIEKNIQISRMETEVLNTQQKITETMQQLEQLTHLIFLNKPFPDTTQVYTEKLMEWTRNTDIRLFPFRIGYARHLLEMFYHNLMQKKETVNTQKHLSGVYLSQKAALKLFDGEGLVFRQEERNMYYSAINTFHNICIRLGKMEDIENLTNEMVAQGDPLLFFRFVLPQKLQKLIVEENFEEAAKLIEQSDAASNLITFAYQIPEQRMIVLQTTIVSVYFTLDNYDMAYDWLMKLLTNRRYKTRPDLNYLNNLLLLICQFEMGMYPKNKPWYPAESLARRWRDHADLPPIARLVLEMLAHATRWLPGNKKKPATRTLLPKDADKLTALQTPILLEIQNKPNLRPYYMFLGWMDSYLRNISNKEAILRFSPSKNNA
ncbi:MAG: hypothetical protein IT270_13000 [Saprospiraceae bacterium]|nr:hypothetical protein [Saprospiraceae bacterium]